MFISEVIVVVLESVKSEIQAVLDKCGFKVKIELFGISGEDLGTADSLRCLQEANKIKVLTFNFISSTMWNVKIRVELRCKQILIDYFHCFLNISSRI
jgi:hypothetical protein